MKRLHFDYGFRISYSNEIPKCFYTIKCLPQDTAIQKVMKWEAEFHPDTAYSISEDGFRNKQFIGCVDVPHDYFSFRISGDVLTGMQEYESETDRMSAARFRYPTGSVRPGEKIRAFFTEVDGAKQASFRETIRYYMDRLYQNFEYVSRVTDISTSAERAFIQGQGVCQDYSHILIAMCQLKKMPARYVAGMVIGEGASHAWVEVFDGEKWIGADPTNNRFTDDNYIKLGIGRDASDCAINRGLIMGNGGDQTLDITVSVRECSEV